MPELEGVQTKTEKTAGFMDRKGKNKNAERIAKDEEELAELEKQLRGETEEAPEGEPQETTQEAKPEEGEEEELRGEEKTYKKRYGDLRRHQQKVEADLKAKIEELEAQVKGKKDGIALPKSDEDLTAWMKKYPDVAGIVKALVAKETDARLAGAKKDLETLRETQETSKRQTARQKIMKVHSDFETLEKSDEFHDWVDEQPAWIANALFENPDDPDSVIRVIDLYKADTSGVTPAKKTAKDAARDVSTKGRASVDAKSEKGTIRESDVAKMSDKEYEENEEAILAAMKNNTFIYDLSKK